MIRLRSLQARMLALSAAATLIALAIAGWVVSGVLERVVIAGIDRRLDAELALLASTVGRDGRIDRAALTARLGALDMGRDWRWRIGTRAGSLSSADFASLDMPEPPRAEDGPPPAGSPMPSPAGRPAPPPDTAGRGPRPIEAHDAEGRVHLRQLTIATDGGPVTLMAGAPGRAISRPIREAMVPLLAMLAILAGVFALAAIVQLRLGLRPVRRLRDAVAAIRAGARTGIGEDQPTELRPLVDELNGLAADNAAALAAARGSAANLAHALKTPVATLALTLADQPAAAAEVARIDATIRHHLARARTAVAARYTRADLATIMADVITTVGALHPGIAIALADLSDLPVAVDPHDLTEIAGNLIDNAARHARSRVSVAARRDGRSISLSVEDDGPGIPADARAWVLQAGARLDEAPSGDGFGLTIVRELAALYGGTLTLGDAAAGGLRATVTLPVTG